MKKWRLRLVAAGAVAALAAFGAMSASAGPQRAAHPSATTVNFQLSFFANAQHVGYLVASHRGYYGKAGLNVKVKPGGPTVEPTLLLAQGTVEEPFFRRWIEALNQLEDMPKLAIAVLHGYAIGGGLQLALACDLRVATRDAILGLGATRHGLIPDGAVLRLARIVGLGRANELALLNEDISPDEARAIGLVNRVCEPGDLDRTLADVIASARRAAPTATGHTKRLLHESFHRDPRAMIEELIRAQEDCLASWEIGEANRAWQDRREAVFFPPPRRR